MRDSQPASTMKEVNIPPFARPKRIYISTEDVREAASSFVSAVARALSLSDLSSQEARVHLTALLDDLFEATEPVIARLPGHQGCHHPFWEPEPVRFYPDM